MNPKFFALRLPRAAAATLISNPKGPSGCKIKRIPFEVKVFENRRVQMRNTAEAAVLVISGTFSF